MGIIEASHAVEIDAPLDAVYEVIADVPASHVWQPSVKKAEALETDSEGRATLTQITADVLVKEAKSKVRFTYSPPDAMDWKQEKGDVKSVIGSWRLTDLGDGRTEAVYALKVDPGRIFGMLIKGPVEDKVKEFLTKGAAEGLKEHMEKG